MNPEKILKMVEELASLKYFPSGNEGVLLAITRLIGSMCRTEQEARWLIDRMTSGLYAEWPGIAEVRACFCSRYPPKDGMNICSGVYLDGIPSEHSDVRQISGPEMLALPPGHEFTADPELEATLKDVAAYKRKGMGGPATSAEISAAPFWLRRLEGLE